jgi:hypothetical protein
MKAHLQATRIKETHTRLSVARVGAGLHDRGLRDCVDFDSPPAAIHPPQDFGSIVRRVGWRPVQRVGKQRGETSSL